MSERERKRRIRQVNREFRKQRRHERRKEADGLLAGFLTGFPFARHERTRLRHPHEPGSDPRKR